MSGGNCVKRNRFQFRSSFLSLGHWVMQWQPELGRLLACPLTGTVSRCLSMFFVVWLRTIASHYIYQEDHKDFSFIKYAAVHFSDGTKNSAIFALSLRWLIYHMLNIWNIICRKIMSILVFQLFHWQRYNRDKLPKMGVNDWSPRTSKQLDKKYGKTQ